jgi:hypothetical protein
MILFKDLPRNSQCVYIVEIQKFKFEFDEKNDKHLESTPIIIWWIVAYDEPW